MIDTELSVVSVEAFILPTTPTNASTSSFAMQCDGVA
jgi:hypothetical protein